MEDVQTLKEERDISSSVLAVRAAIREKGFLEKDTLTSLDGTALDKDLLEFPSLFAEKRKQFFTYYMKNQTRKGFSVTPVFITNEDRDKHTNINRQTKKKISSMVLDMIKQVLDKDMQSVLMEEHRKASSTKGNSELVNLFELLNEYIDLQCDIITLSDEDNSEN